MKKSYLFLAVVILLAMIVFACTSTELLQLTPNAITTTSAGVVLYQDDFSNPSSGWDTWNQNGSLVAYQDGGLRILVNEIQYDYWSRPGVYFNDSRAEVDARKLAGPDDNDFGIQCRYRDQNNYYAFLISSDGYFGIVKVKDGKYAIISGTSLQFSDAIQKGQASNHLRAECIGQNLTLAVNGQKLAEAQDADFSSGEIGLTAGAYNTPGVDVRFDHFVVYKP
ncbi:MAG TPA: hypothetical protein VKF38_07245 [Anaerolineaceae bacterium]|nr:hypothetical protein [Anaerolineaceae bacterium]